MEPTERIGSAHRLFGYAGVESLSMSKNIRKTADTARARDQSAFDTLFARLMPELVAFLRFKAGGVVTARESVHDLAQSVCREVLQDLHEYEADEGAFRKGLFIQATRKIIDRHRYLHRVGRDPAREVGMPKQRSTSSAQG